MDPLSFKLLGQIRQQELLEQASKGRKDTRRWLWEYDTFQLNIWQEQDDAARTPPYLTDGRPRFYRLRVLVSSLLLRLTGQAKRFAPPSLAPREQIAAQPITDPQCISEC